MWAIFTPLFFILVVPLWLEALDAHLCASYQSCLLSKPTTPFGYAEFAAYTALWHILPTELGWPSPTVNPHSPLLGSVVEFWIAQTFQLGAIFTLFELNRISKVSDYAVDSLKYSTDTAVAVGSRMLPRLKQLIEVGSESSILDDVFYKNAAIAIGLIGGSRGIAILDQMTTGQKDQVLNRVVQALDGLHEHVLRDSPEWRQIIGILKRLNDQVDPDPRRLVRRSLNKALQKFELGSIVTDDHGNREENLEEAA